MGIWFFVTKKQALDEWTFLKFDMKCHFLHVEDALVLMEFKRNVELVEEVEALLTIGDLCHGGII